MVAKWKRVEVLLRSDGNQLMLKLSENENGYTVSHPDTSKMGYLYIPESAFPGMKITRIQKTKNTQHWDMDEESCILEVPENVRKSFVLGKEYNHD